MKKSQETVILGVDPSLRATGLCLLYQDGRITPGTIEVKTKGVERLDDIAKACIDWFTRASHVFIEGYAYGAKAGREYAGELGGVLRLQMYRQFLPFRVVQPTTLKKFVTGNGNAAKNLVLEQCFKRFGIGSETLRNDNEVDAYILARIGQAIIMDTKVTKAQKECLKKVSKPALKPYKNPPPI